MTATKNVEGWSVSGKVAVGIPFGPDDRCWRLRGTRDALLVEKECTDTGFHLVLQIPRKVVKHLLRKGKKR